MEIAFPIHTGSHGLLASTDYSRHIHQMIQLVLFTSPGERVNRPDFGCGLERMVFDSPGKELLTASQSLVESQLQQWLGDLIQVEEVDIVLQEAVLTLTIRYLIIPLDESREERFQW